jgi:ABC-type phosphate transport system permease subunit
MVSKMRFRKLLWVLTVIAALIALVFFFGTMGTARSAPREAAGASMALAVAVLPYVLARAADEIARLNKETRD